jgi:hypothetical protein
MMKYLLTNPEEMRAKMREFLEEIKASHKEMKALMDAHLEQMKACLGAMEACLEKIDVEEMNARVSSQSRKDRDHGRAL